MKTSVITNFFKKNASEILTAIGIVGMGTAAVLAVKATPKALSIIEDKKDELGVEKLTVKQTVQATWKCYIPSVTTGLLSACCIIGADATNLKRSAAMSAAYALSETKLKEYTEKVVETVGEKKEKEIKDTVVDEHLKKNPVIEQEVILTERGNTLCYDDLSGRYFKSDIDYLHKVENTLNKRMMSEMFITANDLYYEIGLPPVKFGELGWSLDTLSSDGIVLNFDSKLTSDGKPCMVVSCDILPSYRGW